nr:YTH domain-containing family protein 2 [Ipomoea batatas]
MKFLYTFTSIETSGSSAIVVFGFSDQPHWKFLSQPKKVSVDIQPKLLMVQIQPADRSLTPLIPDFMDPTLCYLPNGLSILLWSYIVLNTTQYPTHISSLLTSGPYPTPAAPAKGEIPISAAAADQATLTCIWIKWVTIHVTNNRGWLAADNKFKPRGRGGGYYGFDNENLDVKGQQIPLNLQRMIMRKKTLAWFQIENSNNRTRFFPETYSDAKLFRYLSLTCKIPSGLFLLVLLRWLVLFDFQQKEKELPGQKGPSKQLFLKQATEIKATEEKKRKEATNGGTQVFKYQLKLPVGSYQESNSFCSE